MDHLPDPLGILVQISETQRTDAESKFIAAEAGVGAHALTHGRAALADGDIIGGWMYVRLLTETGIRIRWIAGPSADQPDNDGAPTIDREDTIARIAAMAKRDYRLTLAGYRAVRAIRLAAGQAVTEDVSDQLAALADRIPGAPAPNDVRQLAGDTPTGLSLYAEFRNSSSIIHPGSALGRVSLGGPERAASQIELAAGLCAGFAAPIYNALV
jgi:hypothetical protein